MTQHRLITVFLMIVAISACSSTVDPGGEGAGTYAWSQRRLKGEFAGSLLDVAAAAERAFVELRLISVEQVVDGLKGTVTAKTADGSHVRVKLKAMDFERTKFSIKVGTFGEKAMSQQVARYIVRELSEGK